MKKYLSNGEAVEVVQKLDNGKWLVYRMFEVPCEIGEFETEYVKEEAPRIVDQIFDEPPLAVFDKSVLDKKENIERLNGEIAAKQKKLSEINEEINCEETLNRDRTEALLHRLKKYEALRHIDAFIEGKITHYVIVESWNRAAKIIDADEHNENDGRGRRLLSLHGDSKGDLQWRLNSSRNDSGSWVTVVPFLSYEEAREYAQSVYDALDVKRPNMDFVRRAEEHNLKLPEGYIEALIKSHQGTIEYNTARTNKDMDRYREEIKELEALAELQYGKPEGGEK